MSNCNEYISADDIKTGKQAINHITHVSKSVDASGAHALEVTDVIGGTPVTNKTLDGLENLYHQAIAAAGYITIDSFQLGATITLPNQVLRWTLPDGDGDYYRWDGAFPKVVASGSTPSTSGGTGPGKWISVGDAVLRSMLSASNGSAMIGYTNPQSQVVETVKTALDKINVRLIYATDFGVKTDSSDNDDALWDLGQFISNATTPLHVIFPYGTSLVGSQELAGATGKGYSHRPTYMSRPWSDASAMGWLSVSETDNDISIDMTGWTLKINDGMKLGAFDPVTGAVAPDQISETPNYDFMAFHGYLIKVYKAPNVKLINGTTNGNLTSAVWGGKFGNTGYQIPCYNMWLNQSDGVYVSKHQYINSPVDGLYHQSIGEFNFLDVVKKTLLDGCYFDSNGRNNYSLTGGANIEIRNPVAVRSGRLATGIGTHYSGPEAGIDIEAEGGNPYNIRIINPLVSQCGGNALMTVSTPGTVNDVEVIGGVLQSFSSLGAISNHGASRNIKFKGVVVIGGVVDAGATMGNEAYSFEDCTLQNRYGNDHADTYALNFKVSRFVRNTITVSIPSIGISTPTLSINDQDGVAFGLNAERFKENKLTIFGDATKITFANGLGGLNNFKNMDLYVDSAGLTGGITKLLCDTSSSSLSGIMTNTTNFNFGVTMDKDLGKNIWYARKAVRAAGVITATTDAIQDIGSIDGRFRTGYFDLGVIVKDTAVPANHYRIRVNNGALSIVIDNT